MNRLVYGDGIYDTTMNWLFNRKRKPSEKLRDGEQHTLLYTKDGFTTANFVGPGTHIVERLRAGQRGVSSVDNVAMVHDIRYTLAHNEEDIKNADLRMLSKLDDIQRKGEDYTINILPAKYGIKGKRFLNDRLRIPTTAFTEIGSKGVSEENLQLMRKILGEMEKQGYGLHYWRLKNKKK